MRVGILVVLSITAIAGFGAVAAYGAPLDASDPKAPVSVRPYVSVFTGYVAYQEQQPGAWREQNNEVGRSGGHSGHGTVPSPAVEPPNQVPARPAPKAEDHRIDGNLQGQRR